MYALLFWVGAIGFVAVTALSFVGADHGHRGGHGPTGEMVSGLRGSRGAHARGGHGVRKIGGSLLSPMTFFGYALGAGAAGLLLGDRWSAAWVLAAAIAAALLFVHGIANPLVGFLLRFAGEESKGLEAAVTRIAVARGRFDEDGKGIVSLELDGELTQVLARLEPGERETGVRVVGGDRVLVTAADESRNRLTVSKELAG